MLMAAKQTTVRIDSNERLLGYLIIANSSNTAIHESVKNNLLEAYIAKRDEYPATRSDAIALLNKYNEKKPPPMTASKGTAFAQKQGKKNGANEGDKKLKTVKPSVRRMTEILRRQGVLRLWKNWEWSQTLSKQDEEVKKERKC